MGCQEEPLQLPFNLSVTTICDTENTCQRGILVEYISPDPHDLKIQGYTPLGVHICNVTVTGMIDPYYTYANHPLTIHADYFLFQNEMPINTPISVLLELDQVNLPMITGDTNLFFGQLITDLDSLQDYHHYVLTHDCN